MHTHYTPVFPILRRVVAVALILIFIASPLAVSTASAASYRVGSIVTFGSYEQDNRYSDGKEPIEWIVLAVKSDRILLLSRYGLDSERYHHRSEETSWDTCYIRDWLNTDFLYNAFTSSERMSILSSNTSFFDDYVFLLSDKEVEKYMPRVADRICEATSSCYHKNIYVNSATGGSWWLLRTTGKNGSKFAMSVNSDGAIDYKGGRVESDRGVIRPAIWVSI